MMVIIKVNRYRKPKAGLRNSKFSKSNSRDKANPIGNASIAKTMLKPILFFI